MINMEEIRGAIARGYCTKANENKVLDPDLCEAIAVEVKKIVDLELQKSPSPPFDNTEKNICQLCGKPMPKGEEMFNFHGYSGNCPE
jgi:hypothetical protein